MIYSIMDWKRFRKEWRHWALHRRFHGRYQSFKLFLNLLASMVGLTSVIVKLRQEKRFGYCSEVLFLLTSMQYEPEKSDIMTWLIEAERENPDPVVSDPR